MRTPVTDTDERATPAPRMPASGDGTPTLSPARKTVRDARRRARRARRLYTLGGLAVLVAFLAATVVVVDMVR